jgi:hypothetical protein
MMASARYSGEGFSREDREDQKVGKGRLKGFFRPFFLPFDLLIFLTFP